MTVLKGRRLAGKAWKITPGSTGGGGITAFTVALSAASGRSGTPVTVTVAPVGGVWPASQVFTFSATTLAGTFSQTSVTASAGVATPITVSYTPTSAAGVSGAITATSTGLTNSSGAQAYAITATAATGYTLTQSASSGVTGQPHSLTMVPTPSGATWPNGTTITLTATGLAGSFSPSATVSPVAATSGAVAVTWTPGATGTATIAATNSAGLTNPASLTYTAASNGAYTPPSAITWSQPLPASTLMGNGGNYTPRIGQGQVVGGIGPFVWTTVSTVTDYYSIDGRTGCVYPGFAQLANAPTDTFDIKCTDGLGNSVRKTITIFKTSDPMVFVDQPFTFPVNRNSFYLQAQPLATGHTANDTFVLTEASKHFFYAFNGINANAGVPAGSYPMTLASTSAAGTLSTSLTLNLVSVPIGPALFQQNVVSDSVPTGYVVGTFYCTTPNNYMVVTLSADSSGGKFIYDANSRQVWTTGPLTSGTYSITLNVNDNGLSTDFTYQIPVQVGVKLASSAMSMTVNPNLDNATFNQIVGAPTVAGMTSGKWYMTQSCYNYIASQGFFGNAPPFAIDATMGQVTNPVLMTARAVFGRPDDTITITRSDGITSCTRTFTVPVHESPTTVTIWTGPGMAAAHPGFGYETIYDAWLARLNTWHSSKIIWNIRGDGSYLGDGLGGYITGPVRIQPVLVGGKWPVTGNHQSAGKACWLFGEGDAEMVGPFEVKDVHGSNSGNGLSGIRKDSNTSGSLLLDGLLVHDNDLGVQSGNGHGCIVIRNSEFYNGGTAHSGSGPLHNIYLGPMLESVIDNIASHHATEGHNFKCRSVNTTITNSVLFDGTHGSTANQIDLPMFGNVTVSGCFMQKGPMATNAANLNCGEEEHPWAVNVLTSHDNTYVNMIQQGNAFDTPTAIANFYCQSPQGVFSSASSTNDTFWLPSGGQQTFTRSMLVDPNHPPADTDPTHAPVVTNPTMLALPPAIDLTSPWPGAATLAQPGPLWRKNLWSDGGAYPNSNHVQQVPSVMQIRIAHTASAGTVLDQSIYATGEPCNGTNPFGPGTTWSIAFDRLSNPTVNPNPWAPAGRYAVVTNPDGTCTLKTGTVALAVGVDYVQVRATSPDRLTLCDSYYPVVVTT